MSQLSLGRLIRLHRKNLGYTIEQLADDEISTGTISNIERDDPSVSISKVDYLLKKLKTTRAKLFGDLAEIENLNELRIKYRLQAVENAVNQYGLKAMKQIRSLLRPIKIDKLCPNYGRLSFIYGKIRMKQKKYPKAKEYFHKTVNCQNGHHNVRAAAYNNLGLIEFSENNLLQSIDFFKRGLVISQPKGKKKYVYYMLLGNIALCLEKLGYYDFADKILDILKKNYFDIEHPYTKAQYFLIKSNVLIAKGDYDQAIKVLNRGMEVADISHLEQMCFAMWTNLGVVFNHIGIPDAAENNFLHALELENLVSNKSLLVKTNLHLASLYMHQKKWDKSNKLIHKAIKLSDQANDALKLIDSYLMLGSLFLAQKNYDDAILPLDTARRMANKYEFVQQEITILNHLANCYREHDSAKYLECLREINSAKSKLKGEEIMIYLKGDEPGEA